MNTQTEMANSSSTIKSWVDLYSDKLFSWAFYKTGNKELAEDMVQDSFLAAFKSFDKFEGKSNPQTWLFSILKNKIAGHYRKVFKNVELNVSQLSSENSDWLHQFFDQDGSWNIEQRPVAWQQDDNLLQDVDFLNTLKNCTDKLPVNWNAALQLKYIESKKTALICQELSITDTNYWQILHRAKLQLRKCLELNWFKK